jgi:hypothetical protein
VLRVRLFEEGRSNRGRKAQLKTDDVRRTKHP